MSAGAAPPATAALPDTRGLNLFRADDSLRELLPLYLGGELFGRLAPELDKLGQAVTTTLDDWAHLADRHPPELHHRTRRGEALQWIEKHPAYQALERTAYGELGLAAMSHRPGVFGEPAPLPPAAKYAFTYIFVQSEFGLCCPVSMTDSLTRTLAKYGAPKLVQRFLPNLTSQDMDTLYQGAMFMTEQEAGSDVGQVQTAARLEDGQWRLYGDKWFCSNADAALAMVLARPEGAGPGTRGLGLFLLPRELPDGSRNHYRIIRLKDKLGTRSMASGEIVLEGAVAYPVGDINAGFKQMAEMINMSRLSNGVRSAGLMRRACHEALHVARQRVAFGKPLIELPLMRRQLVKMLLPTEQALSFLLYTAKVLQQADSGDAEAQRLVRVLTPLIKFRATRDARKVTGDSMEVRGGCGYIEEWINPRLLRDAHLGSIWEGTSNVVALDVLRASRKEGSHLALAQAAKGLLAEAAALAPAFAAELEGIVERAVALVRRALAEPQGERLARQAGTALYNVMGAVLMFHEAAAIHAADGNAKRLVLARLLVDHRLTAPDPLAVGDGEAEARAIELVLRQGPVTLAEAQAVV